MQGYPLMFYPEIETCFSLFIPLSLSETQFPFSQKCFSPTVFTFSFYTPKQKQRFTLKLNRLVIYVHFLCPSVYTGQCLTLSSRTNTYNTYFSRQKESKLSKFKVSLAPFFSLNLRIESVNIEGIVFFNSLKHNYTYKKGPIVHSSIAHTFLPVHDGDQKQYYHQQHHHNLIARTNRPHWKHRQHTS